VIPNADNFDFEIKETIEVKNTIAPPVDNQRSQDIQN
jgi:hypothetical protein